ncbi:DNA-packaging protein, partial [Rhizobium sp. BR5]
RLQEQVFNLLRDWRFIGNRPQQAPEGDWRTWLLIGGRGSGKTRAGAEWVH